MLEVDTSRWREDDAGLQPTLLELFDDWGGLWRFSGLWTSPSRSGNHRIDKVIDKVVRDRVGNSRLWTLDFPLPYCCVKTNTPILLATMMSGLPSLFTSPVVTCVPTPLSSSIRCGMNSA